MKKIILSLTLIGVTFGIKAQITELPNGNVGIGIINPIGKFHVNGGNANSTIPSFIIGGGVSGNNINDLYFLDSKNMNDGIGYAARIMGVNIQNQINASNHVLQRTTWGGATGATAIYLGANEFGQGHFGILTSPQGSNSGTVLTEKLTVMGNGNVGIGISNPKSKFHLYRGASGGNPHNYSSLTVEDSNHSMISILTPNNKIAYFGFSDSEDDYVGGMQYEHSNDRLVFRTNNHGSDLIINNNGNVGIGTSNSGWKLAVNGNIRAKEIKVETGWSDFVFEKDYNLPTLEEVENRIKEKRHLKDIPSAKEVAKNGIFLGEMDQNYYKKLKS